METEIQTDVSSWGPSPALVMAACREPQRGPRGQSEWAHRRYTSARPTVTHTLRLKVIAVKECGFRELWDVQKLSGLQREEAERKVLCSFLRRGSSKPPRMRPPFPTPTAALLTAVTQVHRHEGRWNPPAHHVYVPRITSHHQASAVRYR